MTIFVGRPNYNTANTCRMKDKMKMEGNKPVRQEAREKGVQNYKRAWHGHLEVIVKVTAPQEAPPNV